MAKSYSILTPGQKFDIISKNSFEGLIIVNDSGSIEEWNGFMVDKTGYSKDEIYGKKIWDVQYSILTNDWQKKYPKEMLESVWKSMFQNLQENECVTKEGQFISRKKNIVLTEDIVCRVILQNKNYLYVIQRDRGARKKIEYEDVMTSIVSFQLESLITSLKSFSDIFNKEQRRFDPERLSAFIQNVIFSSEQTLKLLENLMVFLAVQKDNFEINPENCSLDNIISDVIHEYKAPASAKSIELSHSGDTHLFCKSDINVLHLILSNLIDNAIKFTGDKGKVIINTTIKHGFVEISVSDSGIGIDNETKKNLFLMNSIVPALGTNREKGPGIGLVLCSKLLETLGGKIWVESEVSKGSSFVFIIPVN